MQVPANYCIHWSYVFKGFDTIICGFLCLTGNREGKIYVWELQSSPPVLIARFILFAVLHWYELARIPHQFHSFLLSVYFFLCQVVSYSIKISNQADCHVLWRKVTLILHLRAYLECKMLTINAKAKNIKYLPSTQIIPMHNAKHNTSFILAYEMALPRYCQI